MKEKGGEYVWFDGKFIRWEDAKVPVFTHAIHYGTAVFEGIRGYASKDNVYVFRLKEHMERLHRSANIYSITQNYSVKELCDSAIALLKKNNMKRSVYIRPLTFVGLHGIDLNVNEKSPTHTVIIAFSFERYFKGDGIHACVSSWRRISDQSMPPLAKAAGNYLNSILATQESKRNGYDESILLDMAGNVSEASGENIFIVRNKKIYTPFLADSALEGITRDSSITIAKGLGYEVIERPIPRAELYTADEIFLTGTAAEIVPVTNIDGHTIGNGKEGNVSRSIREAYTRIVTGTVRELHRLVNPGMVTKIAVIGVGGWGKNPARVLAELGALAAVCDMDSSLAKQVAAKNRVNAYSSVDDLLSGEKLDACLVCTPTKTHFDVARKVMERGLHTLVEKPLGLSSQECEEMSGLAKRMNVILTAGYIERFNPAVSEARKMINEKTYGELLMIEFHRENRMDVQVNDVGIIFDMSVHDIDTAMFLFNVRPNVVFARAGRHVHKFEDFATIMLGFPGDKVAIIASNWLTPKKVRTFSAVCTEGIISGDFITQEIKIDHAGETLVPRRPYKEPLALELQNFIDSIEGKAKPLVDASSATDVTRVAEAALLSTQTGSPIYLS